MSAPLGLVAVTAYGAALGGIVLRLGLTEQSIVAALLTSAVAGVMLAILVVRRNVSRRFRIGQHRVTWTRTRGHPDWVLVGSLLALAGTWALPANDRMTFSPYLILLLGVAGAVAVAAARLGYERLVRLSPLVLLITILSLALVLIPGIGQPERGREAMLSLGPLSFQPASVAAGAVLLYLAAWMTRSAPVASDDLPETLRYTSLVGLVGALLMLQMNVAAALTIASVGAAMFAIGGENLRHLVTFVASGLFMWFVVVVSGSNHIDGDFLRLPLTQTAHPDTEAGLILVLLGTSTAILVWRGFRAACASVEPFGAVLAAGISSWFAYEALVRIAAAAGLLPNAGLMSLPNDDSLRPVMLFAEIGRAHV